KLHEASAVVDDGVVDGLGAGGEAAAVGAGGGTHGVGAMHLVERPRDRDLGIGDVAAAAQGHDGGVDLGHHAIAATLEEEVTTTALGLGRAVVEQLTPVGRLFAHAHQVLVLRALLGVEPLDVDGG